MQNRKEQSLQIRTEAAQLAHGRPHARHKSNDDEHKFRHTEEIEECHNKGHQENYQGAKKINLKDKPSYLMSFTKGMPHDYHTGLLLDPEYYASFVRAIDSGDPRDFRDTPLGAPHNVGNLDSCTTHYDYKEKGSDEYASIWKSDKAKNGAAHLIEDCEAVNANGPVNVRAWESQSAGLAFDLEGPDAQAVTMPPAPALGSDELTAEMAEIYAQALLRDKPFNNFTVGIGLEVTEECTFHHEPSELKHIDNCVKLLAKLPWFSEKNCCGLTQEEYRRKRPHKIITSTAFRGVTKGDDIGPYISQFLLAGNSGINPNDKCHRSPSEGRISYGGITISQKVRTALPEEDYMTSWDEWYDVQNGADLRGLEEFDNTQSERFIHTPRDLATYVHYDALYEAYLNACLLLLGNNVPFDPGIPFQSADNRDHQQGFAHFGGPHILSLVTEVATRALKAVRFQKYNVHRRCRPEVLAARLTKESTLGKMAPELTAMRTELAKGTNDLLVRINKHNNLNNKTKGAGNYLLPMAFCEGSPMHPSYGAGHATVAGACITVLKAFFDHKHFLSIVPDEDWKNVNCFDKKFHPHSSNFGYVSADNGNKLEIVPIFDIEGNPASLTIEGELNKLASNISIGRNWAGVHYFSDYYESLLMGEQIAIGILEEQKLTYGENFSMTVPLYEGGSLRI